MLSVRDKLKTMKKSSEVGVDQISASDPKPGTSKQNEDFPSNLNTKPNSQQPNIQASKHTDEPMETDFCGPLPLQFRQTECSVQTQIKSEQIGSNF